MTCDVVLNSGNVLFAGTGWRRLNSDDLAGSVMGLLVLKGFGSGGFDASK